MSTDFCQAAKRHLDDAVFLNNNKRLPNADQLYGLAAECALKAVVVGLGAQTDRGGDLTPPFRVHAKEMWVGYETFLSGRTGQRYLAPLAGFDGNPFDDWRVDQRYAPAEELSGGSLFRHARAARACATALQRAITDGVVICPR